MIANRILLIISVLCQFSLQFSLQSLCTFCKRCKQKLANGHYEYNVLIHRYKVLVGSINLFAFAKDTFCNLQSVFFARPSSDCKDLQRDSYTAQLQYLILLSKKQIQ
jgi:hypothetical protein